MEKYSWYSLVVVTCFSHVTNGFVLGQQRPFLGDTTEDRFWPTTRYVPFRPTDDKYDTYTQNVLRSLTSECVYSGGQNCEKIGADRRNNILKMFYYLFNTGKRLAPSTEKGPLSVPISGSLNVFNTGDDSKADQKRFYATTVFNQDGQKAFERSRRRISCTGFTTEDCENFYPPVGKRSDRTLASSEFESLMSALFDSRIDYEDLY